MVNYSQEPYMNSEEEYKRYLRDLLASSGGNLTGSQTLPDGTIVGFSANDLAAKQRIAQQPPQMLPEQQQPQVQPLSAIMNMQQPQQSSEAFRKQQIGNGLRNETTGAQYALQSAPTMVAPSGGSAAGNLLNFGKRNNIPQNDLMAMIQYQSSAGAGSPSAEDLFMESFRFGTPVKELISAYSTMGAGSRAAEKENLGLQKQRAEIAALQAKPLAGETDIQKQMNLMRMFNSIPDPKMRQAFGEKHGFATKPLTPNEKDPSVSEQTAAYHVGKMLTSLKNIQELSKDDPSLLAPGAAEAAAVSMPFGDAYSGTANMARSANRQAIFAKQTDMLDALLYLATGAAYNKEQLEQKRNSLLPSFTDKPEAVAQKQLELQDYMNRAKIRAGKAWTPEMEGLLKTTMGVDGVKSMADQIPKEAQHKITGQQPSAQRYRLKSPELNPKLKSSYEAY